MPSHEVTYSYVAGLDSTSGPYVARASRAVDMQPVKTGGPVRTLFRARATGSSSRPSSRDCCCLLIFPGPISLGLTPLCHPRWASDTAS